MDTNPDNNGGDASFVPFTKAERIKQLGEIDESIVYLLRTVAQAMQSLGKDDLTERDVVMSSTNTDGASNETGEAAVFKRKMNDFLRTLQSVNVRTKRQILGLEEAGVLKLGPADGEDAKSTEKSLEPDGIGKIGGFDVGQLNSRSQKVERDMELELWTQAENYLDQLKSKLEKDVSDGSEGSQLPLRSV